MKKWRYPGIFISVLGLISILLTACGENTATSNTNANSATAENGQKVSLKLGLVTPTVDYWPIYIAQSRGLFEKYGLTIDPVYFETASKVVQTLVANSVDLGVAAVDVSINAIEKGAGLTEVAGAYNKATYSFMVQKDIKSFNDLKGKTLAVSDLKDATTLLLLKMLQANGLKSGDYTLISLGGTGKRAAAITGGQVAGALLAMPTNFVLEAEGYPSLGYTADTIKEYQFETVFVSKEWAKKNSLAIVRYQKAINEATGWLYDPANKAAAVAILAKEIKVSPDIAAKTYDTSVTQLQAFPKTGEFNYEGMKVVIQTMGELDLLKAPLPSPDKYLDTTYLDKARQSY